MSHVDCRSPILRNVLEAFSDDRICISSGVSRDDNEIIKFVSAS